MSSGWEIVGKKKDRGSKLPVPKTTGKSDNSSKNKSPLNNVRIEDVLPKSQMQNLYGKEVKKTVEKPVAKETVKKPQKKPENKEKEPVKPKPPKSIEIALNSVNVAEFEARIEQMRTLYKDGQIVWLREAAQYLNQALEISTEPKLQDPVFSNKAFGYPWSVVPANVKKAIEKSLKEAGSASSVFFGICLTTMATDMSKDLPVLGYKLYLQCIAINDPEIYTKCGNTPLSLLNSYQNRSNIGLSILWAMGNVGVNSTTAGLKVYKDYMLQLANLKHYSRYVVNYLCDILNGIKTPLTLTNEEYLMALDTLYGNKKYFPADLKTSLTTKTRELKSYLFKNPSESYKQHFNTFFKRLDCYSDKPYQDSISEVICELIQREAATLNQWEAIYKNNLVPSAMLLGFLSKHPKVINKTNGVAFKEFLSNLVVINAKLSEKKKKDAGLVDCINFVQKVQEKMGAVKKRSGFPLKRVLFLLVVMITTTVITDVKLHGSWEESTLRRILKDSGVCGFVQSGLDKGWEAVHWTDQRLEEQFPSYKAKVADFSEPYVRLMRNLGTIGYNWYRNTVDLIAEKYPVLVQSIESYTPGMMESSQKAVTNIWSTSVVYVNRSVDYLKTEVFVGQLSPENVQRVVLEAFNTTQQKATEYYHWLYEKVQTTIK